MFVFDYVPLTPLGNGFPTSFALPSTSWSLKCTRRRVCVALLLLSLRLLHAAVKREEDPSCAAVRMTCSDYCGLVLEKATRCLLCPLFVSGIPEAGV